MIEAIRTIELEAAAYESKARELRDVASRLRALSQSFAPSAGRSAAISLPPVIDKAGDRPLSGGRVDIRTLGEAAREVLLREGRAMHHREISQALRRMDVALPPDAEKLRLGFIHAARRYPELIQSVGSGSFMASEQRTSPAPSRETRREKSTTELVVQYLRDNPGRRSEVIAEELASSVTSSAKNPRKLIHSTISYLIREKKSVKRDTHGRLFLLEEDNGLEPVLALGR